MPITYRNIEAPDFRGTAALMRGANESFNTGLDRFSQIITDRQKLQSDQIKQTRDTNQSDFRDYLQSFATPEDLAAAQAGGAIDERLAGYGGVIDTNAVRGAADDRLTALRTGANAEFEFGKTRQAQQDDPVLQRINAMAAEVQTTATSEVDLDAGIAGITAEIERANEAGELSDAGAQAALDEIFNRGEKQEANIRGDLDYAYTQGRRKTEDGREDEAYARDKSTRDRADSRNAIVQEFIDYKGDLTDTEVRREAQKQLFAAGSTAEEVAASVQALDSAMLSRAQTASSDVARGADAKAQLRTNFRVDQNAFNGSEDVNALESVTAIIDKNKGEGQVFANTNDDFKLKVAQDITELLSTGLRINVPVPESAQGSTVKVASGRGGTGKSKAKTTEIVIKDLPPALLEAAMVGVGSKWTEIDQSLPEAVTRLFLDNPGLIKDYRNYEKFKKADLELSSEISRRTLDEQTRAWRNFVSGNAQ